MRSDSTTLTIAHRLATIRRADLIIVLSSDGRVAEKGTYSELSTKPDGAFNKLMQMQMEGLAETPREDKDGVIYEDAEDQDTEEQELKDTEEQLEEEMEFRER